MAARFVGTFEDHKWWVPVTLSGKYRYTCAIFDTGSPYMIFPGECDYPESADEQARDLIRIILRGNFEGPTKTLQLPSRGSSQRKLGSADGIALHRYEFHADFEIPGLMSVRAVPIIFMKTKFPIISVGEFVNQGYAFTLDARGIRVAKRPK